MKSVAKFIVQTGLLISGGLSLFAFLGCAIWTVLRLQIGGVWHFDMLFREGPEPYDIVKSTQLGLLLSAALILLGLKWTLARRWK